MLNIQTTTMRNLPARKSLLALAYALFLLLSLGRLLSSDCFLDGVTYASIARNLALGAGSFWKLSYTTDITPFYAHPPFALWCESLAFRLVGDKPWVESTWGVLLGLLTLGVLGIIWQSVLRWQIDTGQDGVIRMPGAWWPLVLTVLTPLISWCFTNNLLENTLLPLVLLSAYFSITACGASGPVKVLVWGGGSGLFLWLALLTKGPPALFPIVLPFFAFVCFPKVSLRRSLAVTGAMLTAILAAAAFVMLVGGDDVRGFLDSYLYGQLHGSMTGLKEMAPSRFYLLKVLAREMALPGIVLLCLLSGGRHFPGMEDPAGRRRTIFFLALAISGSLPFLAFPKQMEWYLMPSIPFFALALASCFPAPASRIETFLAASPVWLGRVRLLAAILIIGGMVAVTGFRGVIRVSVGTYLQDLFWQAVANRQVLDWQSEYNWQVFSKELLDQKVNIPAGVQISFCPDEIHDKWRLMANLQRHYRANLSAGPGNEYLIIGPSTTPCCISDCYRSLQNYPGNYYKLYYCSHSAR